MLQEVAELGQYLMDKEGRGGLRDYFTLNKIEDRDTLIAVRFKRTDTGNNVEDESQTRLQQRQTRRYTYDGVVTYDLDGNREDILYHKNWHNTNDETPSSMVHRVDTLDEKESREGVVRNDAVDWVFEGWYPDAGIDDPMITDVLEEYNTHEKEIRQAVKDSAQAAGLDDCVLTVQYEDENGKYQFIREFDIFVNHLRDQVAENWAEKHGTTSQSEDERCIVCHEEKEVFGFAFSPAIYTVDNRKYAPEFDQGASWKNLPICADCSIQVTVGVKFIENNSFGFYLGGDQRLEYYVIPTFPITSPQRGPIMQTLTRGKQTESEYSFMDVEYLYSEVSSADYPMALDIVFFTESQSQQQIEQYVSDVEPPWMRAADQTLRQAYADTYSQYGLDTIDYEIDTTEELKQLNRLIYQVLPNTYGDSGAFLSDALDLVDRILRGKPIEYTRLIRLADEELQSRLRNDKNYRGYAGRMFLFITFLTRLNILDYEGISEMKDFDDIMRDWGENVPADVVAFFDEFSETFNHPAKRAVFLEGVLAQHLMDVQSQVRSGDPPLRKKLSNLRLTKDRSKTLLSELFRDIDAYDRKSEYPVEYRDLREAAAMYFAEAEQAGWDITDEEVRYFFTLGLSLNRTFKEDHATQKESSEVSA